MHRVIFIACIALCCLSTKTFCQEEKDTIILFNGQVLIGAVQGASMGAVTIDDIDLKMLSIKLFRIRILIIKERFKIETVEKKIFYGTMNTTNKDGWVVIHTLEGNNLPVQ